MPGSPATRTWWFQLSPLAPSAATGSLLTASSRGREHPTFEVGRSIADRTDGSDRYELPLLKVEYRWKGIWPIASNADTSSRSHRAYGLRSAHLRQARTGIGELANDDYGRLIRDGLERMTKIASGRPAHQRRLTLVAVVAHFGALVACTAGCAGRDRGQSGRG